MKKVYLKYLICFIIFVAISSIVIPTVSAVDNQPSQVQVDGGGTSPNDDTTPAWLKSEKVSCGPIQNIPKKVPEVISLVILLFEIVAPVIIVIIGSIDLAKGVMSQKEDEIKKGQQTFIKRLITGSLIFFIVALVKILVGIVGDTTNNKSDMVSCINCFINGDCITTTTTTEQ